MNDESDQAPANPRLQGLDCSSGHWNCRIMRTVDEEGAETYSVHEVFYRKDGKPMGWACRPCHLAAESRKDLMEYLEKVVQARSRPVLDAETLTDVKEEP
jgi:hypothetical protein